MLIVVIFSNVKTEHAVPHISVASLAIFNVGFCVGQHRLDIVETEWKSNECS